MKELKGIQLEKSKKLNKMSEQLKDLEGKNKVAKAELGKLKKKIRLVAHKDQTKFKKYL